MDIKNLFQKWNELNNDVANSMGIFDFSSIKSIRVKQGEIEDKIYSILLKSASDEIKKLLLHQRVKSAGRLVQQKKFGLVQKPLYNTHFLFVTIGEVVYTPR